MPIALFLYHFTEKLAYLFYYQDFQDSENESNDCPVPSLHWSISHFYVYFRMEIKSEIIDILFHFQTNKVGLFMSF